MAYLCYDGYGSGSAPVGGIAARKSRSSTRSGRQYFCDIDSSTEFVNTEMVYSLLNVVIKSGEGVYELSKSICPANISDHEQEHRSCVIDTCSLSTLYQGRLITSSLQFDSKEILRL